ncbi:PREDICTED: cation channel sperm-associated protein subunit beta [Miniopterus natalensis]|uniref:cation channel sperm-associated protein subunit beta n=1 Tax=Miniopterus natalensis TaxID=291302 RepID=UPI0007A6F3F2|nr:PREDICTED: cation channel sperm-associated protein subunit beta [Miniopterus natalensis]
MELLLLCVIILLLNIFDFSSGIMYNIKGDTEKRFACSSQGFPRENEIIKLYLFSDDLKIQCFFQSDSEVTSEGFLSVFTSGGLAPSMVVTNSTYTGIFHFNLTLFSDRVYWLIVIPRENITKNRDVASVEEWLVRITLQHGLNIYATEGTLLDRVREPIIQWKLGAVMTKKALREVFPYVVDLKVTKCPCANDVALLGFLLNSRHNGVYIGLSYSGFWSYNDTRWYNLTNMVYSQVGEGHKELTIVDMVLTNHFLVILTSLGLFVSRDLRHRSTPVLMFTREDFCGFERADYIKGRLWYTERCFANREHFEVDYITVTFERNRTLSEASSCFYSKEPFLEWLSCLPQLPRSKTILPTVITFLVDHDYNSGVHLLNEEVGLAIMACAYSLRSNKLRLKLKFPVFTFPPSFSPVGMKFHPRSHFLYAYGNQAWLSVDGGNTFDLLADFHDDIIKNTYHSFYTSDITFVTQRGHVYLTKAGLETYSKIGSITDRVFTLYYDHMGFIHKLTPRSFEAGGTLGAFGHSTAIFGQPADMGFETALAPQYITVNEMVFFAYVPENEPQKTIYTKKFNNIHTGKVIHSRKSGQALITRILEHNTPKGFLSAVITEIIEPFALEDVSESSCLSSTLSINQLGDFYKLTLQLPGVFSSFQDSDIEKTVVIPQYNSFLITSVLDRRNALAIATMPGRAPSNITFVTGSWFLYNFGQRAGRTWEIYTRPCNYWFQQQDDLLSLNVLKYLDLGNSQTLKVKVIPSTQGVRILKAPLLKVIVGNPNLLEVKVEGTFDDTDSYLLEASITSKILLQGSTSLAFVILEASTDCFATTFVPMLKSSCSYLKSLHHTPSKFIPMEDWIRGVHKDSQGFNMIKTLPVNYRPPSNMGIAIPLTDNFYHADPSKPIPRNLFHKSKKAGKFKQCAHVSTREECNCTNDQKFSYAVAFSDCREKVPRFKFPVRQYPISLEIHSEDGRTPMKSPYLVTVIEVNQRKHWEIKHNVPESVQKLKDYLESILHVPVYNPSGLNLSIKGSELFHFRVSIIPGVTFCNLVEEFQIYVDEVPLSFPGHTLIAIATAVVLGGLIFIAFMFQIHSGYSLESPPHSGHTQRARDPVCPRQPQAAGAGVPGLTFSHTATVCLSPTPPPLPSLGLQFELKIRSENRLEPEADGYRDGSAVVGTGSSSSDLALLFLRTIPKEENHFPAWQRVHGWGTGNVGAACGEERTWDSENGSPGPTARLCAGREGTELGLVGKAGGDNIPPSASRQCAPHGRSTSGLLPCSSQCAAVAQEGGQGAACPSA